MKTDWRKLGGFVVAVGLLYVALVAAVADFGSLLSWQRGRQLLGGLLLAALLYKVGEVARRVWVAHRSLRQRLDAVRDLILMRAGTASSATALLYAQALGSASGRSASFVSRRSVPMACSWSISRVPGSDRETISSIPALASSARAGSVGAARWRRAMGRRLVSGSTKGRAHRTLEMWPFPSCRRTPPTSSAS